MQITLVQDIWISVGVMRTGTAEIWIEDVDLITVFITLATADDIVACRADGGAAVKVDGALPSVRVRAPIATGTYEVVRQIHVGARRIVNLDELVVR